MFAVLHTLTNFILKLRKKRKKNYPTHCLFDPRLFAMNHSSGTLEPAPPPVLYHAFQIDYSNFLSFAGFVMLGTAYCVCTSMHG